jgi:antirestriction protein ArdC
LAPLGATIRHRGTRAYHAEGPDLVQMPPFKTFRDAESYAATLAHELTHRTNHDKRLARDIGRVKWAVKVTFARSLSRSWAQPSCAPIWG